MAFVLIQEKLETHPPLIHTLIHTLMHIIDKVHAQSPKRLENVDNALSVKTTCFESTDGQNFINAVSNSGWRILDLHGTQCGVSIYLLK